IAVVLVYFRVFTGARHPCSISLRSRLPERLAVLSLSVLIFGFGPVPQPGIDSRYRSARGLVQLREENAHLRATQTQASRQTSRSGLTLRTAAAQHHPPTSPGAVSSTRNLESQRRPHQNTRSTE